jgi:hypothetical protein
MSRRARLELFLEAKKRGETIVWSTDKVIIFKSANGNLITNKIRATPS